MKKPQVEAIVDPTQKPEDVTASGRVARLFVAGCLALLLAPLALMPVFGMGASAGEKRELAPFPQLMDEGLPNANYLGQLGAWFEDRFAFRSELIDLDATWRESLFKTSATPNVIVGTDGWLYYQGTLADYQHTAPLSDRALENIAHNLALEQECIEAMGKRFCVTIAPNKVTLYPEHLPYYVLGSSEPSNLERLVPLLRERGINYVDMTAELSAQDEVLYLPRDSHWNEAGAEVGYRALMTALGHTPREFVGALDTVDHEDDLEGMLHPAHPRAAQDRYPADSREFAYVGEATSVEDARIETAGNAPDAQATLMVYRDSFGNTLLPYLASTYAHATFTKLVPYDMTAATLQDVDDVVVERAERHLASFASAPPYLAAPSRGTVELQTAPASDATLATLSLKKNGPFLVAEGDLGEAYAAAEEIYVVVRRDDGTYEAFDAFHVSPEAEGTADSAASETEAASKQSVTTDYGFKACIPLSVFEGQDATNVQVAVRGEDGQLVSLAHNH